MKDMKITSSLEDYIEAIAKIIEKNGHAHTKDIAEKLNVKMPSVTNALQVLANHGLVVYQPHYPVELTPQGERIGKEIIRRHHVLEEFFQNILKLGLTKASETACKIEHVVSAGIIDKFIILTEAIESREDCAGLREFLNQKMTDASLNPNERLIALSELKKGRKGIIRRIGKHMKGIQKFANLGLVNGAEVEMEGSAPLGNLIRIKLLGSNLSLRSTDADNIWVTTVTE